MALTGNKRAFADAVLAGLSNKEAAVHAGYSAKTAGPAGSRLARDKDVVAYIDRRKKAASVAASAPKQRKRAGAATVPKTELPPPPKPTFDLNAALLHSDPKAFLLAAMNDGELEPKQRIEAAKALMPFMHQKQGEGGKKEQKDAEAKKVASRFAQTMAPRLAAAGGKKV
jgi:phage terminase small subunit